MDRFLKASHIKNVPNHTASQEKQENNHPYNDLRGGWGSVHLRQGLMYRTTGRFPLAMREILSETSALWSCDRWPARDLQDGQTAVSGESEYALER